jgi:copper chaperone NosL
MTKLAVAVGMLLIAVALAGCGENEGAIAPPPPHELTADAIGHYCGMNLFEHDGPKGQIILASQADPIWFSSARDAFSFTFLPEEPKDVVAIYVSDMAKAASWKDPGANNWVEARKAFFVIGSEKQSGMGAPETIPFSDRAAADTFTANHGGRVVSFEEVPRDYVLGSTPIGSEPKPKSGSELDTRGSSGSAS